MSKHHHEKKKKKTLFRESDNQIQLEWRRVTEKTLYSFIRNSTLKNIASFIGQDYYGNMSPFLVTKILGMASPASGIHMGLNAIIETMSDICSEAANLILIESGNVANIPKTPVSITLLCETINMPSITYDQMMTNQESLLDIPLQIRHILKHDQTRDWLKQYIAAKKETIDVLTVRVGPNNTKATSTTGRYIVSVLMPLNAPNYRLVPFYEPHSTAYEELEHKHRLTLVELVSHKRLADIVSKGNRTPHDEALILARQIQHTELTKLKHLSVDQGTLISVLQRQNSELHGILNSPNARNIKSLQSTILIFTKKIKQLRGRVAYLIGRLENNKRDRDSSDTPLAIGASTKNGIKIEKKETSSEEAHKRLKTEHGYQKIKKESPLTSSYSSDEDDYDDDESQYDSNNDHSEEEEDDDDDDSQ